MTRRERFFCYTCHEDHSRRPNDSNYERFSDIRDDYRLYAPNSYSYDSPHRAGRSTFYIPPPRYSHSIDRVYDDRNYEYDHRRVDLRNRTPSSSEESIPRSVRRTRSHSQVNPRTAAAVTPKPATHVKPKPAATRPPVVPRLSLADQLDKHGLESVRVTPDGNCLFRALAAQLGRISHLELRESVCDFIESNQSDFAHLIEGDFSDYLWTLRREGTWGDVETIVAVTKMYPVSITIYQGAQDPHCFRISDEPVRKELRLAYVGNCHYDVVTPQSNKLY